MQRRPKQAKAGHFEVPAALPSWSAKARQVRLALGAFAFTRPVFETGLQKHNDEMVVDEPIHYNNYE